MFIPYHQVRCDLDFNHLSPLVPGDREEARQWALANGWQWRYDQDTGLKLQMVCPVCVRNEHIGKSVLAVKSNQQQAPIQ